VADLVPVGAADGAVDDVLHRRAVAEGRYLADQTVVVENRTFNGAPGAWVLTPLELAPGEAVLVNRGFIGFDREGELVAPPPPPGVVRVEGLLQPGQQRGSFGARDPEEGTLAVVARVDLDRIDAQVPEQLLPAYLQRVTSSPDEPAAAEARPQLVPLEPPDVGEGPHLAYAVQWGIFAAIAAGGYLLLLRRVAKDQAKEQVQEEIRPPV
jgi:cytochrome oxidase assembly protein ShyY1